MFFDFCKFSTIFLIFSRNYTSRWILPTFVFVKKLIKSCFQRYRRNERSDAFKKGITAYRVLAFLTGVKSMPVHNKHSKQYVDHYLTQHRRQASVFRCLQTFQLSRYLCRTNYSKLSFVSIAWRKRKTKRNKPSVQLGSKLKRCWIKTILRRFQ